MQNMTSHMRDGEHEHDVYVIARKIDLLIRLNDNKSKSCALTYTPKIKYEMNARTRF